MRLLPAIAKREFFSYFETPTAYVLMITFLVLSAICGFYPGSFYERNQADLAPFFSCHPWLYLVLMPALAMQQWAQERKSGSIELLLTLPVTCLEVVLGKFLAAWLIVTISLLLTFPMVLSVNYLGHPDNAVIACAYLGSWLLAGTCLAITGCMSALTRNQVIAFILAAAVCLLGIAAGSTAVLDMFKPWAPAEWLDRVAAMSFLVQFDAISQGVLDPRNLLYFVAQIVAWLAATALVVDVRKAH